GTLPVRPGLGGERRSVFCFGVGGTDVTKRLVLRRRDRGKPPQEDCAVAPLTLPQEPCDGTAAEGELEPVRPAADAPVGPPRDRSIPLRRFVPAEPGPLRD